MPPPGRTVTLSNGLETPALGIGTSQVGGFSQDTVLYALRDCGVRLLDTSKYNGFEAQLAEVIRESGVPRGDLWLTNKLWPEDYGYESAKRAFQDSCANMGVDYLDIYMLQWPGAMKPGANNREMRAESWRALEELYNEGLCRSIGVSNFTVRHLEQLKKDCTVVPHVNQVEYHPYQQPTQLMEYCRRNAIAFQGYSPLAKGQALSDPTINQLAEKYERSPAQICIRWSLQNGAITIPKSTKKERARENTEVFGFQLTEDDMEKMNQLHDGRHVSWDPTDVE
ncbi:putative oxidoreductase ZK1290.5 [Neosynchiropus ocellatus]